MPGTWAKVTLVQGLLRARGGGETELAESAPVPPGPEKSCLGRAAAWRMKAPGTKGGFPGKSACQADSGGKESSRKRFPRMELKPGGRRNNDMRNRDPFTTTVY